MREGILDQLPRTLTKDQIVVIFGPSNYPGQNRLKQLIDQLNRPDEWIRSTFRDQISADKVSQNANIVLTMTGINHGVLSTVRRTAEVAQICCPNQALTPSEVKEILRLLADVRGKGVSVLTGLHNGNGNHPLPGKGEAQRLEDLTKSAKQTGEAFTTVLKTAPGTSTFPEPLQPEVLTASAPTDQAELSAPTTADDIPPEVHSAFTAIEKLQSAADEVQLALLAVTDGLKAGSVEHAELHRQLALKNETIAAKEAEIIELRKQLEAGKQIAEEKEAFRKKNEGLESEVRRLRNTLDQFENMIKGLRQK